MTKKTNEPPKSLTLEDVFQKICRWCAYQERSVFETKKKLKSYDISPSDIEKVMDMLVQDAYVSNERFVKMYIHGKFNRKKWGKNKILYQLKTIHQLDEKLIRQYLPEIENEDYLNTLEMILTKKYNQLVKKEKDKQILKKKIITFARSKGYYLDEILKTLNKLKMS